MERMTSRWTGVGKALAIVLGVALPVIAVGVELQTRICSGVFFDPLPTAWHVLIFLMLPLANLVCWVSWLRGGQSLALALVNGVALGVAAFYTVMFAPLMPIGFVAVAFYGLGLCALAPSLALLASFSMGQALRLPAGPRFLGLALAVVLLVGVSLPITMTRVGAGMAVHGATEEERARGLGLLRTWGDPRVLQRMASGGSRFFTDMLGNLMSLGRPVDGDAARKLYFRVTGQALSEEPPGRGPTDRLLQPLTELSDADQGGTEVGLAQAGLRLGSSRLDGSVDADAAVSYLEWTLVFHNDTKDQKEARAQVALPPDGVVSRLTLWVDGEPREAAWASRRQTRAAYQRVVQRRRDPVLVTTCGDDRVLVQCFPVPPGGDMKIRVGITSPLLLAGDGSKALLRLPSFVDRNFDVAGDVHGVWVDVGKETKRLTLADEALGGPGGVVGIARDARVTRAWYRDAKAGLLWQDLAAPAKPARKRIVVVDGSRAMAPYLQEVASHGSATLASQEQRPQTRLADARCVGGQDNLPALIAAWDEAERQGDTDVLWVHGPMPMLLSDVEPLRQRLERRPDRPRILALQVRRGPDEIGDALDGLPAFVRLPRVGSLAEDLSAATGGGGPWLPTRGDGGGASGAETSRHLGRLWARDEILMALGRLPVVPRDRLVELAAAWQLVTPLSGAVVLETKEQYDEAGLKAVDAATVPTIPEPGILAMIAVAAALLARRRRRA